MSAIFKFYLFDFAKFSRVSDPTLILRLTENMVFKENV